MGAGRIVNTMVESRQVWPGAGRRLSVSANITNLVKGMHPTHRRQVLEPNRYWRSKA